MRILVLIALAAMPAAAGASGTVIQAAGTWAAIDRGPVCEAAARSLRAAAKDRAQARAGFTFTADRSRWGEFHARLSRPARPGSSVMATIGTQPFLLVARGGWAWSRGPRQEQAMIAAARSSSGMRIEARDGAGRRFVDRYLLDGAPTAIDAAAAHCAGKSGPR